ncbi:hypothetical protein VTJ83DRAFT_5744 [Remersonia thermophila]|uniref:Initiator tRNA phosphoribosyl transferase n=1 Tax=Remersonia thermophila TaxID=72144 RepID=A0ABR4D7P7_9PEZI
MPPPTLDQLLFPSQAHDVGGPATLSRLLGDLRRADLSIPNRLRSAAEDAAFVADVADALPALPLVANERCGSWYVDPARKGGSAYFKSTDGHTGQWKFSLRRLNLHLLGLLGEFGGCIIVDSTRRGKRMPDALSKTIPTWCAVLNRFLFPSLPPSAHALHTPPDTVSASESAQMAALLPSFLDAFRSLRPDDLVRAACRGRPLPTKPLRPVWITQDDREHLAGFAEGLAALRRDWTVVICCTSSRRCGAAHGGGGGGGSSSSEYEGRGYSYVQGAGDDTENWAQGLTPGLFWRWRRELLDAAAVGEGEVEALIRELVAEEKKEKEQDGHGHGAGGDGGGGGGREGEPQGDDRRRAWERVREAVPGKRIYVGDLTALAGAAAWERDGACVVVVREKVTPPEEWVKGPRRVEVGLGKSKAASRALRDALPVVCESVLRYLRQGKKTPDDGAQGQEDTRGGPPAVVVLCDSGRDLSIGVALAVYCWCLDDAGNLRREEDGDVSFNKTAIRIRLGHIMTALPDVNPGRATLQSVNSFLMDWRK